MHLCDPAGVEEHTLGQRGLPRVDVCRDADVADPLVGKDGRGAAPAGIEEELSGESRFAAEPRPFCHPPPKPAARPSPSLAPRSHREVPPAHLSEPSGRPAGGFLPPGPPCPSCLHPVPRRRPTHGTTRYLPLPAAARGPAPLAPPAPPAAWPLPAAPQGRDAASGVTAHARSHRK